MLMILLAGCSCFDKPVGDFCDRYVYPPSLYDSNPELALKIASEAPTWAAPIKTNRDAYKQHCME